MITKRLVLTTFSLAAFSLIGLASAQAQATAEQRAACTPDAMRLCSSEIPDIGRVTACMKANRSRLSARCQATFASAGPSEAASPRHERVIVTTHVAADGRVIHHRRYAASGYGYRHHGHGYGGYGQSAQAMAIARQVMGGLAMACGNGSLPPDICSMSGGMGGMAGLASMMPY
ncbi:hypothetical protein [Methyloferula stellata]|uniref:hypothetical protein n=1 Tax=Methyloferula stellata TaxID=876270 RepID=UPI00037F9413|nr:hypothetical protein [Methyloferula stellata]